MKHKKMDFTKKLYLACGSLNLILLFICAAFFYYYTTSTLRHTVRDTVLSNTFMLSHDFDAMLENGDTLLKSLQTDKTLLSESKRIQESPNNYFPNHAAISDTFQNKFRQVSFSQKITGEIFFTSRYYDNVGIPTDTSINAYPYVSKEHLKQKPEITALLEETEYLAYIPPHTDYYSEEKLVFSVVRSMRDAYRSYGILELDYDISMLTQLLDNLKTPENYSIALLDENQNLVYTGSPEQKQNRFLTQCLETLSVQDSGTFSSNDVTISGYHVSPVTGWTFILTASTAPYLLSLKKIFFITAGVFLSLFIIMSGFLFILTRHLTQPLKQLIDQLNHYESGKKLPFQSSPETDEITVLTNAVRFFLEKIYDQNLRLTEARKRTFQAHYDAMEAQLNPHFLYNTLSVIGMAGLSSGNTAVSQMCSELASLLRYSLSYTGQAVLLSQEIQNTGSYLYIMKMRYEDDLTYSWELDESLGDLSVPKLILQPLLENCFQHGFRQTEHTILPPWKILISSHRDETNWYLTIKNNGAGFDPEKLAQLYRRLEQFKQPDYMENYIKDPLPRQGFGLENTILRLHIYYHGLEYFQISSSQNGWVSVTIGGPLTIPGQKEDIPL